MIKKSKYFSNFVDILKSAKNFYEKLYIKETKSSIVNEVIRVISQAQKA